jgi:hypothetical protein
MIEKNFDFFYRRSGAAGKADPAELPADHRGPQVIRPVAGALVQEYYI